MTQKNEALSFEKAFEKLENLLEQLNTGSLPLDQSLSCYEEADQLIRHCEKSLSQAEKKIEKLIKDRQGEIEKNADQTPKTESL